MYADHFIKRSVGEGWDIDIMKELMRDVLFIFKLFPFC